MEDAPFTVKQTLVLTLYSLLFSGLGVFSFLLLANYANLTPQVTNVIHTPCAFFLSLPLSIYWDIILFVSVHG